MQQPEFPLELIFIQLIQRGFTFRLEDFLMTLGLSEISIDESALFSSERTIGLSKLFSKELSIN